MEKRTTPVDGLEIRSLVGDLHIESRDTGTTGRTIVGYAAKFECWSDPILGWFREKIARGAFDGCDMQDVIMCFNHRDDAILARTTSGTLRLEADDVGLRFAFEAPHTTVGNGQAAVHLSHDVAAGLGLSSSAVRSSLRAAARMRLREILSESEVRSCAAMASVWMMRRTAGRDVAEIFGGGRSRSSVSGGRIGSFSEDGGHCAGG